MSPYFAPENIFHKNKNKYVFFVDAPERPTNEILKKSLFYMTFVKTKKKISFVKMIFLCFLKFFTFSFYARRFGGFLKKKEQKEKQKRKNSNLNFLANIHIASTISYMYINNFIEINTSKYLNLNEIYVTFRREYTIKPFMQDKSYRKNANLKYAF